MTNDVIKKAISSIEDIKEKIALTMDTCCFASVALEYEEFEQLVRTLEEVSSELSELLKQRD